MVKRFEKPVADRYFLKLPAFMPIWAATGEALGPVVLWLMSCWFMRKLYLFP
jgi:hypothetical protein